MGISKIEAEKKRLKVQVFFWNIVGSAEHINKPKLEDALRKEFHTRNSRIIHAQMGLMESEGRVRVQEKSKVWIKQPPE